MARLPGPAAEVVRVDAVSGRRPRGTGGRVPGAGSRLSRVLTGTRHLAPGTLLLAVPLFAQQQVTDSAAFELGTVTVTGVAVPQLPVSLPTTVLRRDQLRAVPGAPLGRAIEQIPGVRVVGTGTQVAKPVIRGLSGARVLVADAGHRIEDYSWSEEDAPAADLQLAGEVQVTRGPGSLRYGSDAIGGVVNVLPLPLPTASPRRSARRPRRTPRGRRGRSRTPDSWKRTPSSRRVTSARAG